MARPLTVQGAGGVLIEVPVTGIVLACSDEAPVGAPGYAKGCIHIDLTSGDITHNVGTKASCNFIALADA